MIIATKDKEEENNNIGSSKSLNVCDTTGVNADPEKEDSTPSMSIKSPEPKKQGQPVEDQHLSAKDIDFTPVTNSENNDDDVGTKQEKEDITLLIEAKQDDESKQNNQNVKGCKGTVEHITKSVDGTSITIDKNNDDHDENECKDKDGDKDEDRESSLIDMDMDRMNEVNNGNNVINNLSNDPKTTINSRNSQYEMKDNEEDISTNIINNNSHTHSAKRKRGNSQGSGGGGNASSSGTPSATKMKKYYKELHKMTRQAVLERICTRMYEQDKKGEKLKVSRLIEELKADHPWLTRFIVYRAQEKYKDSKVKEQEKMQLLQNEKVAQGLLVKQKKQKLSSDNHLHSFPNNKQKNNHIHENIANVVKAEDDSGDGSDHSNQKRAGRKRGKKGGPRRKFATLYHVPEGAEHAVDVTRVCHSTSFLNKLKRTSRGYLADAYSKMDEAKKERDEVHQVMEELLEKQQEKEAELAVVQDQLMAQKALLESAKQKIQLASEYVTEQELKVECPWNANYNKLLSFKTQHGHIDLPTRCPHDKELDSLCCWVQAQKQKYQDYREGCKNTFKPHRIHLLEKLGIEWNVRNNLWNKHFETLLKFKEEFGHVVVPTKTPPPGYKELAAWVVYQRDQYKSIMDETVRQRRPVKPAISLTKDRIKKLKDVGFVFNVFDERWDLMYKNLKEHLQKEGQFPAHKKNNPKLHHWMQRQRYQYELYHTGQRQSKRCRLTKDRIELLDQIEFPWRQEDQMEETNKVSPSKCKNNSASSDNVISTAPKRDYKKQNKNREKVSGQTQNKTKDTKAEDENTKTKPSVHNHAHHGNNDITKVYGDIHDKIEIDSDNNNKNFVTATPSLSISLKADDVTLQQMVIDSSQDLATTNTTTDNIMGDNIVLPNQFYSRYPPTAANQSSGQAATIMTRKGNNEDNGAGDENTAYFSSKQSV